MDAYGRHASLGIQMVASGCLFGWAGYWLDGKLGTDPWLMTIGLMLGFSLGFYSLILAVEQSTATSNKKQNPTSETPRDSTDSGPHDPSAS